MKQRVWAGLLILSMFLAALALSGCSGGSSGGPVAEATGGSVGIAVDPYIQGAVFAEISATGTEIQRSEASDKNGRFTFGKKLKPGSTLEIRVKGLHNGVPFTGELKRVVPDVVDDTPLVASPLTTLLAEGRSAGHVLEILASAGITLTEADLTKNPMDEIATKPELITAAVAVNATRVLNPVINQGTLTALVALIKDALEAGSDPLAAVSTAVTVVNYVVGETQQTGNIVAAVAKVDPSIIAAVYEQAKTGSAAIIAEEGGNLAVAPVSQTVRGFVDLGLGALGKALALDATADVTKAAGYFDAAVALIGTDATATQNDKDAAYFFSAFGRVVALASPYASATSGSYNTLGDVLEGFGISVDPAGLSYLNSLSLAPVPAPLPETAPTAGELQAFLSNKLGSDLEFALTRLAAVSTDFNEPWDNGGAITEFDHSDVLFVRASTKAMLAAVNLQWAYNFDVNFAEEAKYNAGDRTVQSFFADNPNFGKLADVAALAKAKNFAAGAITDFQNTIAAITAEKDAQADDFITFYDDSMPAAEVDAMIAQFSADLDSAQQALSGPFTFTKGEKIDASKFFAGIDLRSKLPTFTGNLSGPFPDPTLGGLLVSGFDLNQDLDGDGRPDILNGYTRFSQAVLFPQGVTQVYVWAPFIAPSGFYSEHFGFNAYGTGTYWAEPSVVNGSPITWQITDGKLVVAFASPVANWRNGQTMDKIIITMIAGDPGDVFDVQEEHFLGTTPAPPGAVETEWRIWHP